MEHRGTRGTGERLQVGRPVRRGNVIGLRRSVREWTILQGWGGRAVRQEQAKEILVAALRVLAGHFGYGDARRAS
jgi:hypothetical protein